MEEVKEKLAKTTVRKRERERGWSDVVSQGLDELVGGVEDKQELEWRIQELEEKVEERKTEQKDVFLSACRVRTGHTHWPHPSQFLIESLDSHLSHCDEEGIDYETPWYTCVIDNTRQVLVQVSQSRECHVICYYF